MFFTLDLKILVLISAVINFILSWVIFKHARRNKVNISFALFVFFIALWSFSFYFYFHPIIFSHLIWIKIVYFLAFFIIPPAIYFLFSFPVRRIKSFVLPGIIYTICASLLSYFLFFTDLWVKEVIIYPWGPQTITGEIYILYFLFVGIVVVFAFSNLIKNYFSLKGVLKAQLKFVFLGIFSFGIPAIIVDIILPLISGNSRYFWLSPVFSIFLVISTTYAITRYRLMDIKLVIGKGAVYLFSFIAVITVAFLFMFLNKQFFQPFTSNAVLLLGAFCSLLFFQLLKFYEKIAEEYFYHTFYNTKIVIAELEEKLTQILELETFSSLTTDILMDTLKLERIGILVKEAGKNDFLPKRMIGFSEKEVLVLVEDGFLIKYLQKNKKSILQEELTLLIAKARKEEKEKLQELQEQMKQIKASLLLPFMFERNLIGVIILGNKISGDAFSSQDIELLTTLSRSASIALKNASLYSEMQNRKEELEKFYRLTVGRELKMRELKNKIERLEERLREKE